MGTVRSSGTLQRYLSRLSKGLVLCLLSLLFSCATEQRGTLHSDSDWQPWQILDTQTGRVLSFEEWVKNLEQRDIVYLGEEHHNPYHIEAALKILQQLVADGLEPTIAMEMFGWDGQPALDDYVTSVQPVTNGFLEQVRWKQNWGGSLRSTGCVCQRPAFIRSGHEPTEAAYPSDREIWIGTGQAGPRMGGIGDERRGDRRRPGVSRQDCRSATTMPRWNRGAFQNNV
jgi:Haem-binding uptake, Tiki superfamily, ChaN